MMPRSGLSLFFAKQAYEMGTSELHHVGSHHADHESKHVPEGSQPKAATKGRTDTIISRTPLWRVICLAQIA